MKLRRRSTALPCRAADSRRIPCCSMFVLAALGLLGSGALAQGAGGTLPAGTLPMVRGVVSGAVVVHAPKDISGGRTLNIDQGSQRGVISWQSFDIARGSEVTIYQPSTSASTLNRIYGQDPSVVQGSLRTRLWNPATGVYSNDLGGQLVLINQNGILFDRGAQINTGGLIASALNLRDDLFNSGRIAAATAEEFASRPAFAGGYDDAGKPLDTRPDGSRPGNIGIGSFGPASAGAPKIEVSPGNSILVFAPRIDNDSGLLSAPDGQIILAAGKKVFLGQAGLPRAAGDNEVGEITLRGLLVEVQAEDSGPDVNLSNLVRNAGELQADRGNVSIAALAVNQQGRISAKTAVQANGSVFLKGRALKDDGTRQAGSVTLAVGSSTEVLADRSDKSSVADGADYAPYRGVIDVQAGLVDSSGTLRAEGGRVLITAADAADPAAARVYLAPGSVTSAAGAWTDVDFAKNLVTFKVTSNELKNSPDQKTGILRGATVTVDLRQDNNILALDGYRATVQRSVAEKAAAGGEVALRSAGSIVQREGATIDVSGGGWRYDGGRVGTTQLLGADGKVYDIANAPQALAYTAQLDRFDRVDGKFGQTTTYLNPLGAAARVIDGYSEGKAGGSLAVRSADGVVLDGTLKGGVTVGALQAQRAPAAASFLLGSGLNLTNNSYNVGERIGHIAWRQHAIDSLDGAAFSATSALSAVQRDNVQIAAEQLFAAAGHSADGRVENAFGNVAINSNGRVVVPAGVNIRAEPGAQMTLTGTGVDIAGRITLPAGNVTLRSAPGGNALEGRPAGVPSSSASVSVASGAVIATAGAWLNNASRDGSPVGPALPAARQRADGSLQASIDGGSIRIDVPESDLQARFERGATLDAGGGAALSASQRISAGKGGRIHIASGSSGTLSPDWLQADLLGHAVGSGAELSLTLNRAVIADDAGNGTLPADTTRLTAGLFDSQGFSRIGVQTYGTGSIDVVAGTQLNVQQRNLVVDMDAAVALPSGGALRSFAGETLLPEHQRSAASLSLTAGRLQVAETAAIRADARGSVTLAATDALRVDGSVVAPGGSITLALKGPDLLTATDLQVGAKAQLSTAGVFVATPNDAGLVQGTLHNGGSVTLSAAQAGVNVEAGAIIDVSGHAKTVDVSLGGSSPHTARQQLAGHAGTVIVKTQGRAALKGTLRAEGDGAGAAGGSFALEVTRPDNQSELTDARRIVVRQGNTAVSPVPGTVDVTVDTQALHTAGFDKLRLQAENQIAFAGSGRLDFERGIRLDSAEIALLDGARVQLAGANVAIGQSLGTRRLFPNPAGVSAWNLQAELPNTPATASTGSGVLTVQAGAIDFFGNLALSGTQLARFESASDVRFVGRAAQADGNSPFRQEGALASAGSLEFSAAQLYPSTRSSFTVTAGGDDGYILVKPNGSAGGDVYSAAGALTLAAGQIVNHGSLRAPQGQITLQATQRLELGAGSVTSVSGDGLTTLYGSTVAGVSWTYADKTFAQPERLTAVSAGGKRIELNAPQQEVAAGAVVDLRGGGDVLAAEFVPGNGGDRDITLAADTYAIIEKSKLARMPFDADVLLRKDPGFGFSVDNGRDAVLFDGLRIGAGAAVPAGDYALLPARFALLPGAQLVQLQTGSAMRNLQPGQTTTLGNGNTVVAGQRLALATGVRESQSVGVVVLPGSAVQRSSDFTLSGATLLAQAAERERVATPAAPWDAGRLLLANAQSLALQGEFRTATGSALGGGTPARPAQVDIEGQRIAVVGNTGSAPAGTLQIGADSLSRLNASVLLGGRRSDTADGVRITTAASTVSVANDAASAVTLPELLLSASERIHIADGSVLSATGHATAPEPGVIHTDSSGALLRLSNGAQAVVDRGAAAGGSGGTGDIVIGAGARLSASRSMIVDATRSTLSAGQLQAGGERGSGGTLSLSSSAITLGSAAGPVPAGLQIGNADLAAYAELDQLVLRGYQGITLLADTALGGGLLKTLTLDTPLLAGSGNGTSSIGARSLALVNQSGSTAAAAATAGGARLTLAADTLVLGAGDKALAGFAGVTLQATQALRGEGSGALRSGAAIDVEAPVVQAASASNQRISAGVEGGAVAAISLRAGSVTSPATPAEPGLGGQLHFEGSRIEIATTLQASSGVISLQATGTAASDGVVLASGAKLDAAGQRRDFHGSTVAAGGGSVSISAATGAIDMQAGATVDVSAATASEGAGRLGDAGRVALRSSTLNLQGSLLGQAGDGGRSGSASVDLGRFDGAALANFSALNDALGAGGFAEERSLRLRSSDIVVGSADNVAARHVTLTADTGRINIAGTVGRGAAEGGARIALHADSGLQLVAGSRVLAQGSAAGARGGELRASTQSGPLAFDAGAEIDVRAGNGGAAGSVIFGVQRDAAGTVGATDLQGLVRRHAADGGRAASVDLEATRVVDGAAVGSSINAGKITGWASQHQAFVNGAAATGSTRLAALRDENGTIADARLLGALEVRASGDLNIDANWNLTAAPWLAGSLPGTLTVRAAGTLTLKDTLGALRSTDANASHAIRDGDTWHVRLAGGADLGAADPLATATSATTGDVLLTGANAAIRTGTGRIDIAAARHIGIDNVASAIYTAGRIGAADTETNGNNRWAVDGGGISLRAGGHISGPAESRELWVTEWMRRPRTTPSAFAVAEPTDWWAYRPRFQQAVGTLAGGDVDIRAGGDVRELSVMLPTLGRTSGTVAAGTRTVEVTGGGNLELQAGGSVVGGVFMIGRGQGHVQAAGDVGQAQPVALMAMGVSSGGVPEGASLKLQAGGALAARGIDNPTTLDLPTPSGASAPTGPGFGNNAQTSFFTYAANSEVALLAKGGDVTLDDNVDTIRLAADWRLVGNTPAQGVLAPKASELAAPPRFSAVALDGDIVGTSSNAMRLYPSAGGGAALLARGSVFDLQLTASDLAPSALVTTSANTALARNSLPTNPNLDISSLGSNSSKPRITERTPTLLVGLAQRSDEAAGFFFDIQALEGSVEKRSQGELRLPAASRVRAGLDIVGMNLYLQNLAEGDLSVVRADRGDIRSATSQTGTLIDGPGRLLMQAGRNIDPGNKPVQALGNQNQPHLPAQSARLTLVAGVSGDIDLARMDSAIGGARGVYDELIALNGIGALVVDFYNQLGTETSADKLLRAKTVAELAAADPVYGRFTALDQEPQALGAYQAALRKAELPLLGGSERDAAVQLYKQLNADIDPARLRSSATLAALASSQAGSDGTRWQPYLALAERYPRLYADYVRRRLEGALPTSLGPMVFSDALDTVVARAAPPAAVAGGSIFSYLTAIETRGGSAIDLWAPSGDIVVGLTSAPAADSNIGVLTSAGGAIRAVLSGDFNVNQGKVITAQGGDILLYSAQGSVDAGRGAKTSVTTAPPTRTVKDDGSVVITFSGATGSGIQSLSSDPDGAGPLAAPAPGNVYLFAPAGSIDAGEAGIRSGGNIVINAQSVRNASDIRAGGTSQGVPQLQVGSLASALASSNATNPGSKAAEESARAAGEAARKAASAPPPPKPTILSVEVMGFGDRNCKEDDKECFAK